MCRFHTELLMVHSLLAGGVIAVSSHCLPMAALSFLQLLKHATENYLRPLCSSNIADTTHIEYFHILSRHLEARGSQIVFSLDPNFTPNCSSIAAQGSAVEERTMFVSVELEGLQSQNNIKTTCLCGNLTIICHDSQHSRCQ